MTLSLVEFSPLWRALDGFKRYSVTDGSNRLHQRKPVKCRKMLNKKAIKRVDGLLLRPIWPTRDALCVIKAGDDIVLRKLDGSRFDHTAPSISIHDPSLTMEIKERVLFRTFVFKSTRGMIWYHDFAGRLLGPRRLAVDVFPRDDFSPFERLINTLKDEASRAKMIRDLSDRKYSYSRWVGETEHR